MSTPAESRRARERSALRERIVGTALEILEADGIAALTTRRVAAALEYTAPVIYQHFTNKDSLVLELVSRGYAELATQLRQVGAGADPERRLLDAASVYVRFAGQHPHLYEAMNGTVVDAEGRRAAADETLAVLRGLLSDWADTYGVDLGDGLDACDVVWGTLFGMATLGYLDSVGNDRAQVLAAHALGAILAGWRSERFGTSSG